MKFYKYQGTGNDFIMIDNRTGFFKNDTKLIRRLCNRKFGIGADGLILLENSETPSEDFKMVYFNADGNQSTMCGNGGRCIVRFAAFLGIISDKATFSAIDGSHRAFFKNEQISLQMQTVTEPKTISEETYFLDTGSPHYVVFEKEVENIDVQQKGAAIRNNELYKKEGVNVNFAEVKDQHILVRTYERGVENETLSCGTGVTAVAIAAALAKKTTQNFVELKTPGGKLSVSFSQEGQQFTDVWLTGSAEQVFEGIIPC